MRTIKHNLLQVHAVVRILWPRMVKNKQTTTRFVMFTSGNVHVQVSTKVLPTNISIHHHIWTATPSSTWIAPHAVIVKGRVSVPSIGVQVRKDFRINRVFHLISLPWLSLTRVLTGSGSGEASFSAFEALSSSLAPFGKNWSDAILDQICGWTGQPTYRRLIQTASKNKSTIACTVQ